MEDMKTENKISNKERYILLERGKVFTLTALANHLSLIYGDKKSGEKYSAIDCQKYMDRQHLPLYLGGYKLTEIRDDQIGLKLVKIENEVHEKFIKQ